MDDTLLASYVLESDQSHELGSLAARHCGLKTISYDDVTGKGANRISFAQVDLEHDITGHAVDRVGEHFPLAGCRHRIRASRLMRGFLHGERQLGSGQ